MNKYDRIYITIPSIHLKKFDRMYYKYHEAAVNSRLNEENKKARNASKPATCLVCGKSVNGFCNSHSVPRFALKRIAENGKVQPIATNSGLLYIDKSLGVKESGTFQLICRECDSKMFQHYEQPDVYDSAQEISSRLLAEICLKNFLHWIHKRKKEIELYKSVPEWPESKTFIFNFDDVIKIKENDLNDLNYDCRRALRAASKDYDQYYLCHHIILPYVVPMAFQDMIYLELDLQGNRVNDRMNMSPRNKVRPIHVSVFPLEKSSVILMIIDSEDQGKYRQFYKDMKKLSLSERLKAINYMIFRYSENAFISPNVADNIPASDPFWLLCHSMDEPFVDNPQFDFNLCGHDDIRNLLDKNYSI